MLIYNARIINEGKTYVGYLTTRGDKISLLAEGQPSDLIWQQEKQRIKEQKENKFAFRYFSVIFSLLSIGNN